MKEVKIFIPTTLEPEEKHWFIPCDEDCAEFYRTLSETNKGTKK